MEADLPNGRPERLSPAARPVRLEARPAPGTSLCRLDELDPELGIRRFFWFEWDRPERIFVIRDGAVVRAYVNECSHTLVHLDGTPGEFLSEDRNFLQCAFHGARFRISDGHCFHGPPMGRRLRPFPVRIEQGLVVVAQRTPEKTYELRRGTR